MIAPVLYDVKASIVKSGSGANTISIQTGFDLLK